MYDFDVCILFHVLRVMGVLYGVVLYILDWYSIAKGF